MKLIIFHYHLNPGGVTRIIESQLETLRHGKKSFETIVLTGGCDHVAKYEQLGAQVVVDPDLNYLLPEQNNYVKKFEAIDKKLRSICSKEDILHFHNLNLGKNPLVTLAISKMAQEGYRVLNHAHDFSEDRPLNHAFLRDIIEEHFGEKMCKVMYPDLPNYRFAVLNGFDLKRLKTYGVEPGRCSLLPNPVVFASEAPTGTPGDWRKEVCKDLTLDGSKRIVTYPVRVIRRKNIGEFILLAALFREDANWVVTQPPKNPVEIEPYEKWKVFCKEKNINIVWEAGTKTDFEKLLRISDFCLTTSIQEGFGMVFMEPWLLGTPVVGRDIPMVTSDLKASGVQFPLLYDKLVVNDNKNLHEFDMNEQMQVISAIVSSELNKNEILKNNPYLLDLLNHVNNTLIKKNNRVILDTYSLENYGLKLYGLYRRITGDIA